MDLIATYSAMFSPEIRRRGEPYFRRGRVHILESDPHLIRATVQGNELYEIELRQTEKGLNIVCTCPAFRGRPGPCKHIWAVMLHARADDRPNPSAAPRPAKREAQAPRENLPEWKRRITGLRLSLEEQREIKAEAWPRGREILYAIDLLESRRGNAIILHVLTRDRKLAGGWGRLRPARIAYSTLPVLGHHEDARLLATLAGSLTPEQLWVMSGRATNTIPSRYEMRGLVPRMILPAICATGRAYLLDKVHPPVLLAPLDWVEGDPWQMQLALKPREEGYVFEATLRRGEELRALSHPECVHSTGVLFEGTSVAAVDIQEGYAWVQQFRTLPEMQIKREEALEFLTELHRLPHLPEIELPTDLTLEEVRLRPTPQLRVHAPVSDHRREPRLPVELTFSYGGAVIEDGEHSRAVCRPEERRVIVRDLEVEEASRALLRDLGFRPVREDDSPPEWELLPSRLGAAVETLVAAGWRVEAEGRVYRAAHDFKIEVRSNVDWFDLQGSVRFGETTAKLPELLAALRRGDNAIPLGDGTLGLLPTEWLRRYGLLAGLGTAEDGVVRFRRSQVGLLDTLLAAQPEVRV
ncbi:MAG: SWIM zinc finger family protein, partial [Candidatus Eisenbacteria bacterium]|nr:SWIM zinc finger family protein [Candidatus Eisenbacteria bacterium]